MAERKVTADDPRRIEYAARLRAARLAKGLTQERVGELLGVSRTYVNNLEQGVRVESWPNWLAMVSLLGYDPAIVAPELCGRQTDGSTDNLALDPNTSGETQPVDASRPRTKRDSSTEMD